MENYPFVRCLNPQKFCNPHTRESMLVGCGKCPACLMQKNSMSSLKVKLESLSHKYCYFITLTYRDSEVPKMFPIVDESTSWQPKKKFKFVCPDYDFPIYEGYFTLSDIDRCKRKAKLPFLPYLKKRDLQLFIKRLRKHLSNYTDEKIRYFACGEYGPKTFRPHFHLLLWFSQEQTAKNLYRCIHKSWKFGIVDIQKSRGDASSYVAGYLNSDCNLPRFLSEGTAKPFAAHSFFLGHQFLQSTRQEVYSLTPIDFIKRRINLDGVNTKFNLWRSLVCVYFPKCKGFASQSESECLASYRISLRATFIYGKDSPFKIAKRIISDILAYAFYYDEAPNDVVQYFMDKYHFDEHKLQGFTLYEKALRQIYMELRLSYHFIHFVCNGSYQYADHVNAYYMIKNFYRHIDYENLKLSLKTQEEFFEEYDIDDLNLFYDTRPFDIEQLQRHSLYREYKEKTLNKRRESVKHKRLNDANEMFVYM